jgi:hypothetical protein
MNQCIGRQVAVDALVMASGTRPNLRFDDRLSAGIRNTAPPAWLQVSMSIC